MRRGVLLVLALAAVSGCGSDTNWDPDAAVIERLREAGSDLSKPHPIEFFSYFPSKASAHAACAAVEAWGFDAIPQPSAGTDEYLCLAIGEVVPSLDEMHRLRAEFEALASNFDGEYDGWGTPTVE